MVENGQPPATLFRTLSHSNAVALDAVLADSAAQGVDEYWCLGDVVGYGPHPARTLRTLIGLHDAGLLTAWVLGNHDAAFLGIISMAGFKDDAKEALTDHAVVAVANADAALDVLDVLRADIVPQCGAGRRS